MKNLLLVATVILFTSCAHQSWCPGTQNTEQETVQTTEKDDVKLIQAAVQKPVVNKITIEDIQTKLNELGHKSGPIDGIVGPITMGALTRFQNKNELKITGKINPETISSLNIKENATL
jgi:peptidoglycan hydrolase-like protein with peptidoglycan-binding domain